MFDKACDNIVVSLIIIFCIVISLLITLMIKEIRSSVTEYNKNCTLNCKIDMV